jgi:two-component system response regulator FixJ
MTETPTIFVVDDDTAVLDSLKLLLDLAGFKVETFASAQAFLDAWQDGRPGCLVSDIRMPGMDGLELQQELMRRGAQLPVIFITGHGDVQKAVKALKDGASDFIEKPFEEETLTSAIQAALKGAQPQQRQRQEVAGLAARLQTLTPREREVMDLVAEGNSNKSVALKLGISARTVEIHRARMMEKMKAANLSELVRMAIKLKEGTL